MQKPPQDWRRRTGEIEKRRPRLECVEAAIFLLETNRGFIFKMMLFVGKTKEERQGQGRWRSSAFIAARRRAGLFVS
jgi:hypothetical protein